MDNLTTESMQAELLADPEFCRISRRARFADSDMETFAEACLRAYVGVRLCVTEYPEARQSDIRREFAELARLLRRLEAHMERLANKSGRIDMGLLEDAPSSVLYAAKQLNSRYWNMDKAVPAFLAHGRVLSEWLGENYIRNDGRSDWHVKEGERAVASQFMKLLSERVREVFDRPHDSLVVTATNVLLKPDPPLTRNSLPRIQKPAQR